MQFFKFCVAPEQIIYILAIAILCFFIICILHDEVVDIIRYNEIYQYAGVDTSRCLTASKHWMYIAHEDQRYRPQGTCAICQMPFDPTIPQSVLT